MSPQALLEQANGALLLSVAVALPVLAVVAALVVLGPWMGSQIGTFAERVLVLAATPR